MKILISGTSGFIGSALVEWLSKENEVIRLVRRLAGTENEVAWDPDQGQIDADKLEGIDVVIHLGGESLTGGRWTVDRKKRIADSRIKSTRLLADSIAVMQRKPKLFICASAVGFYGDQGNTILTENSPKGKGFLADVCEKWESACDPAIAAGVRVVNTRLGVVLDPSGGALKMMLFPFKWGLGGKIGSGLQYMSWVALSDVLKAISFIIRKENMRGPVNLVSPSPVTNEEFTKALGHSVHRPTFFSVPTFALHGLLGDAADEVLLSSTRVVPEKLMESGFIFQFPSLESYLQSTLESV